MADLLVLVPTRGRPENALRLTDAFASTRTADTDLLFVIDADDPQASRYFAQKPVARVDFLICYRRKRLGPTLNWAIGLPVCARYRAIGFMGDDHLPRTPGWDAQLLEALDELGSGFVYGNDLNQYDRLPTACFATRDVIQTLGYLVPAGLIHLYIDNAWKALGEGMGRLRYLPDTVIEHLHPSIGKSEMDNGYQENNSAEMYSADRERYERWLQNESAQDAEKLRALL